MGLADKILAAGALRSEAISVPEWGITAESNELQLRELSGAERDHLTQLYINAQVPDRGNPGQMKQMLPPNYKATIIQMAAIDAEGQPIFDASQIEKLSDQSAQVLDRLSAEVTRLSGMAGITEGQLVTCPSCGVQFQTGTPTDEAEANLSETPSAASGSDLL